MNKIESTQTLSTLPSADLPALIADWLGGKSHATIRAYREGLDAFARFLDLDEGENAARYLLAQSAPGANALVLRWKNSMQAAGLAPASINLRLAAVRSLVGLAQTLGLVTWGLSIHGMKAELSRDVKGPGMQTVSRMIGSQDTSPKGIRDRAILTLLGTLALRRGEICSLDLEHLRDGALWVLGKGRTCRVRMELPPVALAALAGWLQIRGNEPGPLFLTLDRAHKPSRMGGNAVWDLVRKAGMQQGQIVRTHGIRHSAITAASDMAASQGLSMDKVRDLSRHSNLATLSRYLDRDKSSQGMLSNMLGALCLT